MRVRRRTTTLLSALLCCSVLTGCGEETVQYAEPFSLPVGPTEWDNSAPAWFRDGTLHVGDQSVELRGEVDEFVIGATGAYWTRGGTLMFTSVGGETQEVAEVGWQNMAVSADRTVFATVDQSRGPTDRYGTHVIQVAAFDTRTGTLLHRTPDEEPDPDDDLANLYGEIMPLLRGVSPDLLFFGDHTIDLASGATTPTRRDGDGIEYYEGFADALFPDGFHVAIKGTGNSRHLDDSTMFSVGRLSPDRSTIFDVGSWPSPAVVYDARTGRAKRLDSPWKHLTLVSWSDPDTFVGVAQEINEDHPDNVLRASQVVTCELASLTCTPVSPVVPSGDDGSSPDLLVEGPPPF